MKRVKLLFAFALLMTLAGFTVNTTPAVADSVKYGEKLNPFKPVLRDSVCNKNGCCLVVLCDGCPAIVVCK